MKAFKLDTLDDGYDEILFGDDAKEVEDDVLYHHELEELPAHWSLEELSSYSPAHVVVLKRIHDMREREARGSNQQSTFERLDQLEVELEELLADEGGAGEPWDLFREQLSLAEEELAV